MAKGNLLVGQSGGCTPVINQTLVGIIEQAKRERTIGKILGTRCGVMGILNEDFVNLGSLRVAQLRRIKETPSSALGSCRYKLQPADEKNVLRMLIKHNVKYFLLIGGNDTAQTSLRISQLAREQAYDLTVVAVPKTIDNDLPYMDHTPGYGSVATFIAATTQEAGKDTESMRLVDPVKVIEVMGRNSGWLVAASALGKKSPIDPPHLLYFPERRFDERKFLHDVKRIYRTVGYVVIVVAETVRDKHGYKIGQKKEGIVKDSFGHVYVEGASKQLCHLVESHLKLRARFDKPGTIQRMSMGYISPQDQKEAHLVGTAAVRLAAQKKTEVIVTLNRISSKPYKVKTGFVSIDKIAGVERYLPDTFINKEGNFVTPAFVRYARPLIGKLPSFERL